MENLGRKAAGFGWIARVMLVVLALIVGGFSAFVGWNKAFAPLPVLVEHSAWTIHLPAALGRAIGWLEMAAAATLVGALPSSRLARFGVFAAVWITLNHAAAAVVHVIHAEWHTLPQSALAIALCLVVVALYAHRVNSIR